MKQRSVSLVVMSVLAVGTSIAAACATGEDPRGTRGSGGSSASDASSEGSGAASAGGSSAGGTGATSGGAGGASSGGTSSGGSGGGEVDATPWDDAPDVRFVYDASSTNPFDPDSSCADTVVQAQATPLDLYVMLDISASMLETASAGGPTKWEAVRTAMTGFLNDGQSAGIGVGIQYFPLINPNVPDQCTSSADCGTGGICALKTCSQTGGLVVPCNSNADCLSGEGTCVNLGRDCRYPDEVRLCIPGANSCSPGSGFCVRVASAFCSNQDVCDPAAYGAPAVPIALLPAGAQPIINSMNSQFPAGATPTGPALQGAVTYARSHAQENPTHTVAVAFATDGLPTSCRPYLMRDIAAIASSAASGSPSVKTFVIGVFASGDTTARNNLNQLAAGGGTGSAYILDANGNVSQQFIDALNQIRGVTLGCEFQMPKPEAGIVDPTEVQVAYTPSSGTLQVVQNVSGSGACTADQWYYDNGITPTKIILCPSLCTNVKAEQNPKISISLGCLGA